MDKAEIRAMAEEVWQLGVYKRLPPGVDKIEAALTAAYEDGDKQGYKRGWEKAWEPDKQITQLKADLAKAWATNKAKLNQDLVKERDDYERFWKEASGEKREAEAKCVSLKADLAKFGGHTYNCNVIQQPNNAPVCDCDWAEIEKGL